MVASICGEDFFGGGYAEELTIRSDTAAVIAIICDDGRPDQVIGITVYDTDSSGAPERSLHKDPSFSEWRRRCGTRLRAFARYYSNEMLRQPGYERNHHELAKRIREELILM
jgi:hypothetical protein